MTKHFKSVLLKLLGRQRYLQLTSKLFLYSFRLGFLKSDAGYANHYFVRNFIKEGDTIIDIGANLGYYTTEFARLTGKKGLVLAVEPVPHYRSVLLQNIKNLQQVKVLPYALGEEEGSLNMGITSLDKHRHGLMKVLNEEETRELGDAVVQVSVKHPAQLFEPLHQLHFIKCDIEGYEIPVLPAMKPVIEKHRPVIQVETDGENKKKLLQFFKEINYSTWQVITTKLVEYSNASQQLHGDLIAIPAEKEAQFNHLH